MDDEQREKLTKICDEFRKKREQNEKESNERKKKYECRKEEINRKYRRSIKIFWVVAATILIAVIVSVSQWEKIDELLFRHDFGTADFTKDFQECVDYHRYSACCQEKYNLDTGSRRCVKASPADIELALCANNRPPLEMIVTRMFCCSENVKREQREKCAPTELPSN